MFQQEYAQYCCIAQKADPTPSFEIKAVDNDGKKMQVNLEKENAIEEDSKYLVHFSINFNDVKAAIIRCEAKNEAGKVASEIKIRVQCKLNGLH